MTERTDILTLLGGDLGLVRRKLDRVVFSGRKNYLDDMMYLLTEMAWEHLVDSYNRRFSSRKHKPLSGILKEAERRGAGAETDDMTGDLHITFRGLRFAYSSNKSGRFLCCTSFNSGVHPKNIFRITFEADKMFDCMEELADAMPILKEWLDEKALEVRCKFMTGEISMPSIMLETDRRLLPKGVKYYVCFGLEGPELNINVVKEVWFRIYVDMESLDHVLSLVPYVLKRPDCIGDIGRRYTPVHDYRGNCEREWRAYHDKRVAREKNEG